METEEKLCRNTVCQGILSGVTACFVAAGFCHINFCRILLAAVIGSACVSCRTETGPVTVPAASGNMYAAYFELLPDAVVSVSPFTGTGDTLFIDAPMDNIVCMSSSHMAFLSEAGASEVVTGVSGKRFVTDRKIAGNAVEVGYESAFDYESVMALKPDVVLAYTVSSVEPAYISRLEDLGIRVLVLYDHLEQHPLARAEYIRLAGAITGRKEYADSVFSEVARRYTSIAAAVRGVPDVVSEAVNVSCLPGGAGQAAMEGNENRSAGRQGTEVKVLLNLPYAEVWYVPGADSYMARLISDAGGTVLGAREGSVSSSMSLEKAYRLSREADFWLNTGNCRSRDEICRQHPLFCRFGPMERKHSIHNNIARMNAAGGNDFWESGAVRPDIILSDLVAIFGTGPANPCQEDNPAYAGFVADSIYNNGTIRPARPDDIIRDSGSELHYYIEVE